MWWFLGFLGLGIVCALVGWKKSPKCDPEPEEMFWSREYKEIYRGCLDYAEQLAGQLYKK